MNRQPRLVKHPNYAYDPWYTRPDFFVSCSVCGFRGIDVERWQEPEQEVFTMEETGTTYAVPAGTPVEGLSAIDVVVFKNTGTYAGCPLCGSPNWASGSAPDLKRY